MKFQYRAGYQTPSGTNAYVLLTELADISLGTGAFYHLSRAQRTLHPDQIQAFADAISWGAQSRMAQQRIALNVLLGTGYRITWAGEFEELQQAKARLAVIVPISLLMILALLYGLFNSLRDSLMALTGIPFAAGGGSTAGAFIFRAWISAYRRLSASYRCLASR